MIISTHAPRTGSDLKPQTERGKNYISTHAPRTGSDPSPPRLLQRLQHFNPRSPHGERLEEFVDVGISKTISTHAPRTGSDATQDAIRRLNGEFQPTLPARGATAALFHALYIFAISTHAPRTGSDPLQNGFNSVPIRNFNPRSPHGERPDLSPIISTDEFKFQPTLPARGATTSPISSEKSTTYFNPRSPHGERQTIYCSTLSLSEISTHAPRTGSDALSHQSVCSLQLFQPTLPARGATARSPGKTRRAPISTHAPRTGSDGECFRT